MYRLTPRMLQSLRGSLELYHGLFSGGRCQGWELEELIVKAIQSDTGVNHHVIWTEAGHDDNADLTVKTNEKVYPLQVKSGKVHCGTEQLVLSGHRLGRFSGNMEEITTYLNSRKADIIAVPYEAEEDERGKTHVYQVSYIAAHCLAELDPSNWDPRGTSGTREQTNPHGVEVSIRPSMSWQVWWKIPLSLLETEELIRIN